MATPSQPTRLPLSQVSETLEKTVVNLDQARAADLDEMSIVRDTKFAGLTRDRARLVDKLGDMHPRVIALDRSLALHRETAIEFKTEIAVARITPPRVTRDSWALHGIVLETDRAPIQGLTLALYLKKVWIQRLGYACTDENGYFILQVDDARQAGQESLSLGVVGGGKLVYLDPTPVVIQPGRIEYREVILDKSREPCPSPDGDRLPIPPAPPVPAPTPPPGRRRQ